MHIAKPTELSLEAHDIYRRATDLIAELALHDANSDALWAATLWIAEEARDMDRADLLTGTTLVVLAALQAQLGPAGRLDSEINHHRGLHNLEENEQ